MCNLSKLILVILLTGVNSYAGIEVLKVWDGKSIQCNASTSSLLKNEKVIDIAVTNERENNQEGSTLKISLFKCLNNEWTEDLTPSLETYIAPNGMKVTVTYSDFELLLIDGHYNILLQTSLDYLSRDGYQVKNIGLAQNLTAGSVVDAFIRGRKTIKADNGYTYSQTFSFGTYRIHLK